MQEPGKSKDNWDYCIALAEITMYWQTHPFTVMVARPS